MGWAVARLSSACFIPGFGDCKFSVVWFRIANPEQQGKKENKQEY